MFSLWLVTPQFSDSMRALLQNASGSAIAEWISPPFLRDAPVVQTSQTEPELSFGTEAVGESQSGPQR
jgi:hypothetical protein